MAGCTATSVAGNATRTHAACFDAKPGFVVAKENAIPESFGSSPGHLHGNGAVGASGEDFHCAVTDDAGETATGNDSFELYH